jgi:glycerol-3-phosphate dehydrogenase
MKYDVIIVGAGVVGALTARELARYDLKVLVLEREPDAAMGATKANSAIVHGGFAEGPETLKGRLCIAGRRLFSRLEEELAFGFRPIGSLVVSFQDDPSPLQALYDRGRANGLDDVELWPAERVREHEPAISRDVSSALWCAGAGVCSPWDLAYAALENAAAHGVELKLNSRVVAVEAIDGLWRLSTSDATFETRYVVNAAGLGGGALDSLAGLTDSTISARTGEYVVFAPGTGSLVNSVIFQLPGPLGKGVLVTPTYQNNLLIGPDARNEPAGSGPEWRHTHADRLANVVAQASRSVDGIDLKKAIRSFTGVRAGAPGGDFLIGRAIAGWHRAVGVQSPGLTASPAIAKLLVTGLADDGLTLSQRPFDPSRRALPVHLSRRRPLLSFPEIDALTRLGEGDPNRVLCRCEQVTEADLAEACGRGLPVTTVDALKRRTRAGMGWCQGRFCRPRVAQWMEARLGTPVASEQDFERLGLDRVAGRDLWALRQEE